MKKILGASLLLLGMATVALADAQRVITTTGRGAVEAVPDMALISIGVTHEASAAGDALSLVSGALQVVMDRLDAEGIAARDMQTQGLSLQPVWTRDNDGQDAKSRITGFVARNGLAIRIRDLDRLGAILDTVVSDGANTFNGLQFSVQDTEAAMAEARAKAVKSAMAKAEQFAQAAGVDLGPVQSISENGDATPRPMMMEMASARMAADVPVAAGEVSLSAQVSMVFEILE